MRHILLAWFLFIGGYSACSQNSKVGNQPDRLPEYDADARLSDAFGFFVLGDWGTGGKGQKRIAEAMTKKMTLDGAQAVFTVGDNFYGSGVSSITDPQWQSKFERMYPASALNVPFYATLGNHDYGESPQAQVEYTGTKLADGSITRWRMPGRYWTERFTLPDGKTRVRVVGLDTQEITSNADGRKRQVAWLDSVLAASTEEWKIVFGHHPVFSNGMHGNTIAMVKHVKPLFEKHGVQAYFCGHDHDMQLLKPVKGVLYVISGGGAGSRDVRYAENTIFAATNLGFSWCQVNTDSLLVQFLDSSANVTFAYTHGR